MSLAFDRALRREAEPNELVDDTIPERGLGQQEEIVGSASQHRQWRDQTGLRRQEERLAGLVRAERLDVVRDHPLQVGRRVRAGDADVLPRASSNL